MYTQLQEERLNHVRRVQWLQTEYTADVQNVSMNLLPDVHTNLPLMSTWICNAVEIVHAHTLSEYWWILCITGQGVYEEASRGLRSEGGREPA